MTHSTVTTQRLRDWPLRHKILLGFSALICAVGFAHIVGSCKTGPTNQEQADVLVLEQTPAQKSKGIMLVESLDMELERLEVAKAFASPPNLAIQELKVKDATQALADHLSQVAGETGQDLGIMIGGIGASMIPGMPPALAAAIMGALGLQAGKMFTPGSRGLELMIAAYRKLGKVAPGGSGAPQWKEAARLILATTGMAHSTKDSKAGVAKELKLVDPMKKAAA